MAVLEQPVEHGGDGRGVAEDALRLVLALTAVAMISSKTAFMPKG